MIPLIAQLGPLPIHSFGLLLMCGILAGWYRLALSLKAAGLPVELAERATFWGAIAGLLGARFFYIISNFGDFLQDPVGVGLGQAGFVFYGSLISGALAVWWVTHRAGVLFLQFADLASVPLIIGYGVGRIGCQLSGDGDYGIPSTLPWAMSYVLGVVPTDPGVLVHPAPVYESLAAIGIALVLHRCEKARVFSKMGQLFGLYLVLAGAERIAVEFIRIEPRILWSMTQAQLVGFGCILVGISLLLRRVRDVLPLESSTQV